MEEKIKKLCNEVIAFDEPLKRAITNVIVTKSLIDISNGLSEESVYNNALENISIELDRFLEK